MSLPPDSNPPSSNLDLSRFSRLRNPWVFSRSLLTGGVKIAVISVILVLASKRPSLHSPDISQWKAYNTSLGLLILIWAVGLAFECLLVLWVYSSWGWRYGLNIVRCASFSYRLLKGFRFIWLIVCNVHTFQSIHTGRYSAPYIWWLAVGILSLEFYLQAALIVILRTPFYLFWPPRDQSQASYDALNAVDDEIWKLSKSVENVTRVIPSISPSEDQKYARKPIQVELSML